MVTSLHRAFVRRVLAIAVLALLGLAALLVPQQGMVSSPVDGAAAPFPGVETSPLAAAAASLTHGSGPVAGKHLVCAETAGMAFGCSIDLRAVGVSASQIPHWTNLTGPVAPPRSDYVAMTYDALDHYVVLFGGLSSTAYPLNDTWTFSNGQWTNITATAGIAPVARYGMAMTYDPSDGYVLAYGGTSFAPCTSTGSTACNDTWSFAGGKWSKLPASPPRADVGAPYDNDFSMTYDATDSYVLATNGFDTWRYSGGVWSPFCGSNCTSFISGPDLVGMVAYDASDGYVLFFGAHPCNSCGVTYRSGSYTWQFSAGAWANITASAGTPPPSRQAPVMTSDSSTKGVLLFGGIGNNGSMGFLWLNDTWLFENGSWNRVLTSPSPDGSYAGGVADDAAASIVVLFGGDLAPGNAGNLNGTWVWGKSPPIGELSPTVVPSVPLPGAAASFNVTFEGGVAPFTYEWTFADGTSSTLVSPAHVFSAEGFYNVQIWVNDSVGHSAYSSIRVHVYIPLTVSPLQATPNPAVFGQPVNLTANASGGTPPYSYSWAFGDGGTGGNLSVITHIYTTNGPFLAEVTVSDSAGGVAHAFLNISIQLQALAGSSATGGSAPLSVAFVAQAEGGFPPFTFLWNFGDGTPPSTAQYPKHTYGSSGRFTVVLTVTDSKSDRSTSSLTLQVGPTSTSGSAAPSWFEGFIVACLAAGALAIVWGAVTIRLRSQRREGERWIEELTAEGEPPREGPNH